MKIGIDARELLPEKVTGIGRFLNQLLIKAKEFRDFEFILFGNQDTDFEKSYLRDYKKYVINEKNRLWWDQISLKNVINKSKIDIFFSPYYKIPLLTDIPTIVFLFDLIPFMVEPYKNQIRNKIYLKNFIQLVLRKIEKVITSSYASKKDLIKMFEIPEEKIGIIYLSINKRFKPTTLEETIEIKKKYNIQKKYILYVGNSSPHKNLNRLIDAYNLLPENVKKEYRLFLAGIGGRINSPLRSQLSTINCQLLHYVSDDDLPALYSAADLFVFPSLYEGFGYPPLEAMACGCPVISSNTSSMPEILGNACQYFNPYNVNELSSVMREILENNVLRNELRQKGFNQIKIYNSENMIKQFLGIFKQVYETKNSRKE